MIAVIANIWSIWWSENRPQDASDLEEHVAL